MSKSKMRIVAMTNEGQLSMMKNMLNSAHKAGLPMDLFHCYVLSDQANTASYGTPEFKSITTRKLEIILENMYLDSNVLWIDNDIVLFENILNDIMRYKGHFIMQDDLWSPCTGFFLARTTSTSLSIIKNAILWLNKNAENRLINDQHAFQTVTKQVPFLIIQLLPRDEYPNGEIYFNQKRKDKAKIVHCNYLKTTEEKIQRFKDNLMWNDSDDAFKLVNIHRI